VCKSAEYSMVAIRSIRRDAMEQFKKLQKNGDISEDDQYRAEDEMQKTTDSAIKDIDQIAQEKEKEILSV
jgi:ribosome recycling factor